MAEEFASIEIEEFQRGIDPLDRYRIRLPIDPRAEIVPIVYPHDEDPRRTEVRDRLGAAGQICCQKRPQCRNRAPVSLPRRPLPFQGRQHALCILQIRCVMSFRSGENGREKS